MSFVPDRLFLTKGVGKHRDKLTSFEMALRDAEIAQFNLVRVSSIYPPQCRIVSKARGLSELRPGQIVFVVMSENSTNEPNRLTAASVGLAMPTDRNLHGYLSEFHSYGLTEKEAGDYAEDQAATMLATTLGVPFDPDRSYDEKKEQWRISGKIYRTQNITQSAIGPKGGLWITVIAAAVLILADADR